MKKILTLLLLMLAMTTTKAQVVTTDPVTLTQSAKGIVITFHADGGNKALMGTPSTGAIYAHTGLITSSSSNAGDWKYATTWGSNDAKYKLTYVSENTWSLTIPDIPTFYGITSATEQVRQLAFVFRDSSGNTTAKTATGGDIFVQVFDDGFPSSAAAPYPGGTPRQGTVTNADGSVTFCLGAPGKSNVLLLGSWNSYAIDKAQLMSYQDIDGMRYFWTTVSGLGDGKAYPYYFLVDGAVQVADPYARLVLDPWNDQYIPSTVFPGLPAYPSSQISNVPLAVYSSAYSDYSWKVTDFKGVPQDQLIVYEILVRDFTGTEGQALASGTIAGAMAKLDYIKELGVNAVELMPVTEFSGNNSWGYNPNFYFAPDKAYGTPDAYKAFIDAAHERGLAVILDMVFNQSDSQHPWYNMYHQSASQFYNGSAPHSYSVFYDWNQGYAPVMQQWCDALDYWMTEYKIDGFRFDLVKGLGDSDSYDTPYYAATNSYGSPSEANTNKFNATRVARMKALRDHMIKTRPDAYFINENLAGAQEENDMARDGEINWANINEASCEYAMGYLANAGLDRFYAPLDGDRLWGSTVSYAESHDEERVAYKVAQYAPTAIKNNPEMQMRRLGSLAAQMLMCPGAHMIWQFEELGADQTTKSANGDNNTGAKKVIWNRLNNSYYKGLHDTYAAMCDVRAKYPHLFTRDTQCKVLLSSSTARFVSIMSGDSELYLAVNPAVSDQATIAVTNPVNGATVDFTATGFEKIAASYNTTPVATAKGISLPAGAFALYGRNLTSGIDDIISDTPVTPRVRVENRIIRPVDPSVTDYTVSTLAGIAMPHDTPLAPGIYLVTLQGNTIKVIVK